MEGGGSPSGWMIKLCNERIMLYNQVVQDGILKNVYDITLDVYTYAKRWCPTLFVFLFLSLLSQHEVVIKAINSKENGPSGQSNGKHVECCIPRSWNRTAIHFPIIQCH